MTYETLWPAPAKLNLFLHVTGRRPDGYHELQTVFQLIDLCDTIAISVREDGRIERPDGPPGVDPEADLTVRAARALQQATGCPLGATLRVRKRIPMGGGLGGGSSDAASVLLGLNAVWGCGLPVETLARLGLPLGADVPVFVRGSSAWGQGVGEDLQPLELPESWYVVIHPGVAVGTRDVFQSPELTRNSPVITIRAFFQSGGRNDCEPVVRARFPEVAEALDWLGRLAPARLTGTGSCIFAPCATAIDAERLAARVPDRWTSYVARGLNVSPVHELLRARG
ncbi:MAG TPA: 4-(cytidine 5'-diphospho)-2-C-methyl-D-erythritol kinase [Steroidobacteraceae bacterium]|nr:4-(cytidine 5'-diphospho)-2-C-methyl-D-erythritol kinase [Steroidobacteraceae bacterium]